MFLEFSPVTVGQNLLTLSLTDLDLFGVNDPWNFLESVRIISNGVTLALVESLADPEVVQAQTNSTGQVLQLALNVATDPFWLALKFKSIFPYGTRELVDEHAGAPPGDDLTRASSGRGVAARLCGRCTGLVRPAPHPDGLAFAAFPRGRSVPGCRRLSSPAGFGYRGRATSSRHIRDRTSHALPSARALRSDREIP